MLATGRRVNRHARFGHTTNSGGRKCWRKLIQARTASLLGSSSFFDAVFSLRASHVSVRMHKNLRLLLGNCTRITIISRSPLLLVGNHPTALIGGFMKLTPGKLAGLQRVSDKRGVIAAAAMD